MRFTLLATILISTCNLVSGQDLDSALTETPFQKGRWISGLSGSISTSTVSLDTTSDRTFTNQYGINLQSGKFIADRWALGMSIEFRRRNTDALIEETSDLFQVGPFVRFYTSKSPRGSFFFQGMVNYAKFQEETIISQPNIDLIYQVQGDGVGLLFGIGYSYAMSRAIAFDLGINYNWGFFDAEVVDSVNRMSEKQNIEQFNTSFNFGFVILIDEFFF